MTVFWIVIIAVALVLEAATVSLISVWFAAGAVAALIASSLTDSVLIQFIVFTLVSVVCVIYTRPFLKKFMQGKRTPTNSELNIGKSAIVIEEIDNERGLGRVKLDGVDWRAISGGNEVITVNTSVIVTEVQSAKLIVKIEN
ncbi:MAG: NfeD family protein [Oscillospiraceae bacterium]|nr:NfeD family protein [Oscillospiraceae bacterium]